MDNELPESLCRLLAQQLVPGSCFDIQATQPTREIHTGSRAAGARSAPEIRSKKFGTPRDHVRLIIQNHHMSAAIECLGVDTAGFETLLTVIFFAIGFLMLQATQPRASPKEGNGEKYRHWSAGAKPTVSTSSHLSAMNFRWSQSAPKRPIEWDFVPMCG